MATPSNTPPQGTDVASNGNGLAQAQNVTLPKDCKEPLCNKKPVFGDYCSVHGREFRDLQTGIRTGITNPQPSKPAAPSRRELQRQLDRLEGKIDSLIAAIGQEDDSNGDS